MHVRIVVHVSAKRSFVLCTRAVVRIRRRLHSAARLHQWRACHAVVSTEELLYSECGWLHGAHTVGPVAHATVRLQYGCRAYEVPLAH